jgi:microcompartment protein CcmL/EutN
VLYILHFYGDISEVSSAGHAGCSYTVADGRILSKWILEKPVVKIWAEIHKSEHKLMADGNGNGEKFYG